MSIGSTGGGHARPEMLVGGRYRLLRRLGSGGYGRVWQAHDTALGVDVAVKEVLLPPSLTADEHATRLARAEREARNAARLRGHPNVVSVYDVVVEDGVPWTVMELVHGRSLQERLETGGPLTPDQAGRVAGALLRALDAAHRAGLLHRDVKPANVMLADDGAVLLTDFGIAVSSGDPGLTAAGAVVGSAEYLAPERVRGHEAGPPSDLFSLGVTLYEAVEGLSPFRRAETAASFGAVLLDTPPSLNRATGALGEVIRGLMEKEPAQRMTAQQALDLFAITPTPGPTPVPPQVPATAPGPVPPQTPALAPRPASPLADAPNQAPAPAPEPTQFWPSPLAAPPSQVPPHTWPAAPPTLPPAPGFRFQPPPAGSDSARTLVPFLLTAYFAIVAFLPAFTIPADVSASGTDITISTWQLFRWYPGEPGGEQAATSIQVVGLVLTVLTLAALTPRSGPGVRALAYLAIIATAALELFTAVHYGGPWTVGLPTGPGYWGFWLGLAALAVAVPGRDAVTRRTRKVA
ncbi:serine/threonine-protein kinase [Catenulispora subtropica]|uniref:non-specific serine/threonine protein kinase n=1 Tax=Catenulispora subtropica TaxID=450798 RepID=A0ABN2T3V5_9ACTN